VSGLDDLLKGAGGGESGGLGDLLGGILGGGPRPVRKAAASPGTRC
jgi:hypothetical protein